MNQEESHAKKASFCHGSSLLPHKGVFFSESAIRFTNLQI
jgi:hypothetical protein